MAEKIAIFAGGCFWCMVEPFENLQGVKLVRSGYTGGHKDYPTYAEVKAHLTGHTEAVKIWFDDAILTYETLLDLYWQSADPTDSMGQFQDRGDNYRPVIFVNSEEQRLLAETSKAALVQSRRFGDAKIVTKIESSQPFWEAEEEHQQFYQKNPTLYAREHTSRERFFNEHWQEK